MDLRGNRLLVAYVAHQAGEAVVVRFKRFADKSFADSIYGAV
jgi:hypothetical protein